MKGSVVRWVREGVEGFPYKYVEMNPLPRVGEFVYWGKNELKVVKIVHRIDEYASDYSRAYIIDVHLKG